MPFNFTLGPASIEELDAIIDLGEQLQLDTRAFEPLLIFDKNDSRDHYNRELTNPNALITVASLEDGTVAGYQYSYVRTLGYLSSRNRECVLEALFVDPKFRGQGIGAALIDNAQHWATHTMKVQRIAAHIYAGNEASIQLHTKDGFKPYNIEFIKYI